MGVTQDETDSDSYMTRGMIGYARIVLPLTGAVERIDCKRLYELEIEKLRMEIELMKLGLEG